MSKATTILLFLVCLASSTCAAVALADYYRYTDSHGVVSITNKLGSVPARYRSSMKVIHEEALSKADPGARSQPQPEGAPEPGAAASEAGARAPAAASRFQELSLRYVWLKPLSYLVGVLAIFLLLTKLTSLLPSRLLARAIYLAFSLGVFLFLYKTFAGHLLESSQRLKDDALSLVKKSRERQESIPGAEPTAPEQK